MPQFAARTGRACTAPATPAHSWAGLASVLELPTKHGSALVLDLRAACGRLGTWGKGAARALARRERGRLLCTGVSPSRVGCFEPARAIWRARWDLFFAGARRRRAL